MKMTVRECYLTQNIFLVELEVVPKVPLLNYNVVFEVKDGHSIFECCVPSSDLKLFSNLAHSRHDPIAAYHRDYFWSGVHPKLVVI